jgi:hypothetical protein
MWEPNLHLSNPRSPASLFASFAFEKFHKAPSAPKPAAPAGKTPEVTLVDAPLPTSRPWSEDLDLPKITPDLKEIQSLEKEQLGQVMQQQQQKIQRKRPANDPVHGRVRRNATGNMSYRGTSDGVKKQRTKYTVEQLARQKLERDAAARQKEEQNLEKKKNARLAAMNWRNGAPRGADVPTGEFGQNNMFGWTMLITRADDSRQVPDAEKWQHSVDYKVKFICDSQDPQILLQKSKGVKKIHAISSMTLGAFPDESAPRKFRKLYTYTMGKDNLTIDNIRAFLAPFGINDIPDDKVQAVLEYHNTLKPADFKPEDLGLEMMLFKISQFGFFSTDDLLGKTMSEQNPWVIVIRLRPRCDPIVDKLFRGTLDDCAAGVFPFAGMDDDRVKYSPWVKAVQTGGRMAHQPWMQKPIDPQSPDKRVRYGSHPVVNSFTSRLAHRETISYALFLENQGQSNVLDQTCEAGRFHNAKVLSVDPETGKVIVDLTFNREEVDGVPKIGLDAVITVSTRGTVDVAMADGSAEGGTAGPPDLTSTTFSAQVYEDGSSNADLKLLFNISKDQVSNFNVGDLQDLSINVEKNQTPLLRQLAAVDKVTRFIPVKDGKESGRDLQNILMGLSVPFVEQHIAWWDSDIVSPQNLQLAENYIASAGFNTSQQACLNDIFRTTNLLTLTQGPPGTGKSAIVGGASVVANVLNKHVLGTAPTNTAAGQMLRHCIAERRKLRKVEGGTERAGQTSLVYLPTIVQTKQVLQMAGLKTNSIHFYTHFIELKQRDSLDMKLSENERNLALQWLKALDLVRKGGKMSPDQLDVYLKVIDADWKRVFDQATGPMTVITTSNNAHILAMYTKWKPDLCIVDEAAFGTEGDSLIPLSMRPTRVFLVGDHKQLRPIVLSAEQNEYSDQAGTSLFKRLVDCGWYCYRLEINYRMHWRISLFPAAIMYDHLGNGANTYRCSDAYKACQEFWNSDSPLAEHIRTNRVEPWDKSVGVGDCRRIIFNTRGSRSAPASGFTSLRNFGNINAIIDVVGGLSRHKRIYQIDPKDITILSPYKGQKLELAEQLKLRLPDVNIQHLETVDSIQGGENEVVILDLTAAHEHHGGILGFLKDWSRMNVALTRARSALWIFGNLDAWSSEIEVMAADEKTQKWALLMVDLMNRGDIVQFYSPKDRRNNFLPATREESEAGYKTWSREIEHVAEDDKSYNKRLQKIADKTNEFKIDKTIESLRLELRRKLTEFSRLDRAFRERENMDAQIQAELDIDARLTAHEAASSRRQALAIIPNTFGH